MTYAVHAHKLILTSMYTVYTYIYIYICVVPPPPPQRSTKINAITNIEFGRSWEGESALNHPNHFGIIFDSGWDPRSKIQDSWEVFPVNLGSNTGPNHPNHFGIIFDSGPDPRSKIQDCPALPTSNHLHMTILFNSSYSQACPHDHPCTHTSIHCKVI